jgi:hypothetical protein
VTGPLLERFWARVEKTPTCWLWRGAIAPSQNGRTLGYGNLWDGRRLEKVHRIAYVMAYGPIPDGMEVSHDCDTPPCVRPTHLRLRNHFENMRDMYDKGRTRNQYGPYGKGRRP